MKKMELTAKESKKDTVEAKENEMPKYPWGLSFQLNNESLKKLSLMEHPFEIGDEVEIKAMCKITSVSAYENMKEDETKCVNLQIIEMDCKPEGGMEKTAKKVYKEK